MYGQGNVSYDDDGAAGPFSPLPGALGGNNGLSISTIDPFKLVLGQDVGELGNPADLLSNREIRLMGFGLNFLGSDMENGIVGDGSFFVGGPASVDALYYWNGHPNNFGTIYAGHGVAGGFSSGWERFDGVNTYPRPNVVWQPMAYNYSVGGGIINPAEAGMGFRWETDFDLNGAGFDFFELHMPEMGAPSGLVIRPFSLYVSKQTLAVIHQGQIQSVNYNSKNENETYLAWTCNTAGGPPDTDRSIEIDYTGKGNNALIRTVYADQTAIFSTGAFEWDRGSFNLNLSPGGASVNNKEFNITANVLQTGVTGTGASFFITRSVTDQITEVGTQLFADTFINNPTFEFDRRLGAGGGFSSLIGDGSNGGEISWSGDRNLNISGIANGIGGGIHQCFDLHISAIDPSDNLIHDQMIVSNAGDTTLRNSLTTGDPGSGSAPWKLGKEIAAVIAVDLTRYLEVNINGTVWKIVTGN